MQKIGVLVKRFRRNYPAALLTTAVFLPGMLTFTTMVIYLSEGFGSKASVHWRWLSEFMGWAGNNGERSLFLGSLLVICVWLVISIFFLRLAEPANAIPSSYQELQQHLSEIAVYRNDTPPQGQTEPEAAWREIKKQCDEINSEFSEPGISWVLAKGYIDVWSRMYRAEEALIEVAPIEKVLADAVNDEARLQGSAIEKCDDLLAKLRQAAIVIDPDAAKYLVGPAPVTDKTGLMLEKLLSLPVAASGVSQAANEPQPKPEAIARSVLRAIHKTINDYRNQSWNGLVMARNRLLTTMIFTGLTAYALLIIALLHNVPQPEVRAAAVFFLVGAVVGLLDRLRRDSQSETAIEDYGLSAARLITIPQFSGLAAIGGVVFVIYLPFLVNVFGFTPVSSIGNATSSSISNMTAPAIVNSTSAFVRANPIDKAFDLGNGIYFIVAAIFGLTPSLLLNSLHQQAETFKANLKSIQASEGKRKD